METKELIKQIKILLELYENRNGITIKELHATSKIKVKTVSGEAVFAGHDIELTIE